MRDDLKKTIDDVPANNPGVIDTVINDRDREKGGIQALLSGEPGSGKTNALIRIVKVAIKKYGDRILWRGSRDCEWNRFIHADSGSLPVNIFLHQNVEIKRLINRTAGEEIDLEDVVDAVERFRTYRGLIDRIGDAPGAVNVIYCHPFDGPDSNKAKAGRQWLKVFDAAVERVFPEDLLIAWDELEDIFPLNDSRMSTICDDGADILKAARKNHIHGFYATHFESQVDWRVLSKIPYSIYMRKAKCKKDRVPSSLDFSSINGLPPGQAYFCGGSEWERKGGKTGSPFKWEGKPDKWILRLGYDG